MSPTEVIGSELKEGGSQENMESWWEIGVLQVKTAVLQSQHILGTIKTKAPLHYIL